MFLIGLYSSDNDTHALPRTKATLIYRHTRSLRAVHPLQIKLESTVRYLGIQADGALEVAEHTELRPTIGRASCGPVVRLIGVGSPRTRRIQRSRGH